MPHENNSGISTSAVKYAITVLHIVTCTQMCSVVILHKGDKV